MDKGKRVLDQQIKRLIRLERHARRVELTGGHGGPGSDACLTVGTRRLSKAVITAVDYGHLIYGRSPLVVTSDILWDVGADAVNRLFTRRHLFSDVVMGSGVEGGGMAFKIPDGPGEPLAVKEAARTNDYGAYAEHRARFAATDVETAAARLCDTEAFLMAVATARGNVGEARKWAALAQGSMRFRNVHTARWAAGMADQAAARACEAAGLAVREAERAGFY